MQQERTRERGQEAGGTLYDQTLRERAEWVERAMAGKVLIRGDELPVEVNRQGRIKRYLNPKYVPDTALTDWIVFVHDVRRQSGRHRHQGGLVLYVMEGEGTTDFDGTRVDWKAGDLMLLPIKPDGVAHRHFNRDTEKGCKWMAFKYEPFGQYVMDQMTQLDDMPVDENPSAMAARLQKLTLPEEREEGLTENDGYQPLKLTHPNQLANVDLVAELLRRRDHDRFLRDRVSWFVQGDRIPWQLGQQGILRWYMHPALEYVGLHTLLFYMQQIPPGSRSGRQRHGGNLIFYVQEGRGHTVLDGVTLSWGPGDMILIPNRPNGAIYQHFNDDPSAQALLVAAEPNLVDTIGLDRGGGFEQLETCPEYQART